MAAERQSAVRFFAPDHPTLANTLRAKLQKRQVELAAQISDGYASDWPDYKHRSGVIAGLTEAIRLCAETEKALNGD